MKNRMFYTISIFLMFLYQIVKYFAIYKYPNILSLWLFTDTIITSILIMYSNLDITLDDV